ncbi:MAG TPA: HAMP domain-containing sensor histidine kinase [Patescibacteria group bacterium]|nr:HAMP domain-containing sensor histidine kinase [Patescibacteria group bacterium]
MTTNILTNPSPPNPQEGEVIDELHQDLVIFEEGIKPLIQYALTSVGQNALTSALQKRLHKTPIDSLVITADGIDFSKLHLELEQLKKKKQLRIDVIISLFRIFYQAVYETIVYFVGTQVSRSLLHRSLVRLQQRTDDPLLISRFLEVMPAGLFEKERLTYLSRAFEMVHDRMQDLHRTADALVKRDKELTEMNVLLKHNEQELDKTAKTLIQRDLELTNANQRLTELDSARSEFFAIASHQLRTPLSAIKWYASALLTALESGKSVDQQVKYLHAIYDSNERLIELVNAFLNVSRIETGSMKIDPQPYDIAALITTIHRELKPLIDKKSLRTELQLNSAVPPVPIDVGLMRIVIENLLTNAIKYTPEGGAIIVTYDKPDPKSVQITVSDTGYGIPDHQQSKIFTKMFRSDNIKVHIPEGTGLGLYIAKSIINKAGGKIWFKSAENKGSTFYLSLPVTGMQSKVGIKNLM